MTLQLIGLTRKFGNLVATDNLSMTVADGAIHGLIGPNGSGKSTLLNLVSGFLKPTAGRIVFDGRDIGGLASHVVSRSGIVRTFQLIKIFGELSVRENVRTAIIVRQQPPWSLRRLGRRVTDQDIDTGVAEILTRMSLDHVSDRLAGTLPGGIQRSLSVACAFAVKPRFLLLDEPLAGLHATEKAALAARIAEMNREGITILLVEHDVKAVMALCSTVTVLQFGKMIAEGPPSEIQASPIVHEAYLGKPGRAHA